MDKEINKIFIISAGRTGTKLFGDHLEKTIPNSFSEHEPDNVDLFNFDNLIKNIKRQSFKELFILKGLGQLGSRNISLRYLNNTFSKEKALEKIKYERRWIEGCKFYFEANQQLYGLTNILPEIPNSKVLLFFRDPRDWVRSIINKGKAYTDKDILYKINVGGFKRISPENLDKKSENWKNYNQFQRICWVWNYINTNFYNSINGNNQNIRHYFFEDIFIKNNENTIRDFLEFALDEYFEEEYVARLQKMLQNKVNENTKQEFHKWHDWDKKHCQDLHYFCGDLMQKLGYGNETEWLEKIQ